MTQSIEERNDCLCKLQDEVAEKHPKCDVEKLRRLMCLLSAHGCTLKTIRSVCLVHSILSMEDFIDLTKRCCFTTTTFGVNIARQLQYLKLARAGAVVILKPKTFSKSKVVTKTNVVARVKVA